MHKDYEYTTNYAHIIVKSAINKTFRRSDVRLCTTSKFSTINVGIHTNAAKKIE